MTKLWAQFASKLQAIENCEKTGNIEWFDRHTQAIDELEKQLPHGSGFDKSTGKRLVFVTAFHHMDDNGFYCGWTDHLVIVTPVFDGVDIRVTGSNKRDIKDFIADTFLNCQTTEEAAEERARWKAQAEDQERGKITLSSIAAKL